MITISEIKKHFSLDAEISAWHNGIHWENIQETTERFTIFSPINTALIATIQSLPTNHVSEIVEKSHKAFLEWRLIPAPLRGEVVRKLGNAFRTHKEKLAQLISIEIGKTIHEARGEVQEVIDICDFAVGLSRQIGGQTFPSERAAHRLMEQYHPLGVVGIISAFNFPVAVWAWNTMIALVCGDTVIWKPSERASITAAACMQLLSEVFTQSDVPMHTVQAIFGDKRIGKLIAQHHKVALVSATGSTTMGKEVAQMVAARLGKVILELGGNNASIVSPHANLDVAIKSIVFGIIGTAGQRCTSLRRIIVHESVYGIFIEKVKNALANIKIGNPFDENVHMGPLAHTGAVELYQKTIKEATASGATLIFGGNTLPEIGATYVMPTLFAIQPNHPLCKEERFIPVAYVIQYSGNIDQAIHIQNDVPQGLSSSLYSDNVLETEQFLSPSGSDCGIANINLGTSGAEIGLAFGGEKETGGGRESGSDAWKAYMRRQSTAINFSGKIMLAQGIKFDI